MNDNKINIDNELEDLKALWKNQPKEQVYDKEQIFKMIHRKSINSVQWLFIISILEFALGIGMSIWSMFSSSTFYPDEALEDVVIETSEKLENYSYFGLIGSTIFIIITYYFYRKVSSQLSVSELIKSIINFRRAVMIFIICWLAFSITILTPILLEYGINTYTSINNAKPVPDLDAEYTAKVVGWTVVAITIGIILLFSVLYYGIIYGLFLRRLGKNLKDLKNIV